jgi:hypothetical protein
MSVFRIAQAAAASGREGPHLLVAGGDGANSRRPSTQETVLSRELNSSAQAQWLKTVQVFNEQAKRSN